MLKISQLILLSALAFSCNSESTSELKRSAIPNDPNVRVVRVMDGSLIKFVMVSGNKGFELSCSDPLGLLRLVDATGFPSILLNAYPPITMDAAADLKIDQQPKLTCKSDDKLLYKVDLDGKTKYFFGAKGSTKLYMFGCQGLVDAMGFDLMKAHPLDPMLIDENPIFNVSDEQDLNCLQGVAIGSKASWDAGKEGSMVVTPGKEIPVLTYAAKNPNGLSASLSLTKEGQCDWLNIVNLPSALVINGTVPTEFIGQTCKLTVTADAGTIAEDSKSLLIETCKPNTINVGGVCQPIASVPKVFKWAGSETVYTPGVDFATGQVGFRAAMSHVLKTNDGGQTWTYAFEGRAETMSFSSPTVGWYSGEANGLVYRTTDAGATFEPIVIPHKVMWKQLFAPSENNVWVTGYYNQMVRTQDNGASWTEIRLPIFPNYAVRSLEFVSASIVYLTLQTSSDADHPNQVWRSLDAGETWQQVLALGYQEPPTDIHARTANHAWLATQGTIYRTADGGKSWEKPKFMPVIAQAEQVAFHDERIGWAVVRLPEASHKTLLLTRDGGITWYLAPNANIEGISTFVNLKAFGPSLVVGYDDRGNTLRITAE
ncbi:WD40/YVTN/BNR-like repeat-containing protein [Oligoflexus tunisiensis]|uniref:WD40/YVTN/BNR-like repeat-containing protein n=1 Tax=Oligoflexus tunisiensis TaxID=708132 RepID=UPI00114CC802|nr:YCF48-related protein [Oligoflexus tunisiensis]